MSRIVAYFNGKTLHHPKGDCGHISFMPNSRTYSIYSWASGDGRFVRSRGKVCGACKEIHPDWKIPPLVAEDDNG
jgi:hypothetical protein